MTEAEFLKTYDITKYDRPSVTVDIAAFGVQGIAEDNYRQDEKKELSILLIKRGGYPFKDMWALPGGFVQKDETIEESFCSCHRHGARTVSGGLRQQGTC